MITENELVQAILGRDLKNSPNKGPGCRYAGKKGTKIANR